MVTEQLLDAFKNRLGVSDYCGNSFNLENLLQEHSLGHMDDDFSPKEIYNVIKTLPKSHAPGDGFDGLFLKKCWNIVKQDFFRLVKDFCIGTLNINNINSSHIALIPKKGNPATVHDYRPISLLNYSVKKITTLISIILQSVIVQLMHANQYGFIKEPSKIVLHWPSNFYTCVIIQRTQSS